MRVLSEQMAITAAEAAANVGGSMDQQSSIAPLETEDVPRLAHVQPNAEAHNERVSTFTKFDKFTDKNWKEIQEQMDHYFRYQFHFFPKKPVRANPIGRFFLSKFFSIFSKVYRNIIEDCFPSDIEVRARISALRRSFQRRFYGYIFLKRLPLLALLAVLFEFSGALSSPSQDGSAAGWLSIIESNALLGKIGLSTIGWLVALASLAVYSVIMSLLQTFHNGRLEIASKDLNSEIQTRLQAIYGEYSEIRGAAIAAAAAESSDQSTYVGRLFKYAFGLAKRVDYIQKHLQVEILGIYQRREIGDFIGIVLVSVMMLIFLSIVVAPPVHLAGTGWLLDARVLHRLPYAAVGAIACFLNFSLWQTDESRIHKSINVDGWQTFDKFDVHDRLAQIAEDLTRQIKQKNDQLAGKK
jgi:hypothetical protein